MKRKNFLLTSLTASPLIAFSRLPKIQSGGASKPFVVVAGASRRGETIKFLGLHPNDCKISGKDTGGQLSVFEYTGLDKVGPMLHLHYHQDEIFTVIEGNYRFVVGTDTYELKVGDTIFLPRNIPHTWIQLSDRGKLIYFLQPAGKMEEFFSSMNALKARPGQQELDQLHEAHGMKVVGPPLSL
jgi:quercetin dioxygenase-like cupin family protein